MPRTGMLVVFVSFVCGTPLASAPSALAGPTGCADARAFACTWTAQDPGRAVTPPVAEAAPAAACASIVFRQEPGRDGHGDAAGPARAATGFGLPTRRERFEHWGWNAFGPFALAGGLTTAAWGQWVTLEPPEWARDGHGYLQRTGAAEATTAITETSVAALSALERQDASYYRCPRAGLRPRLAHALRMTFMARRADGRAVFSVARTASPFVGPLVTRTTIYPDRYGVSDGLKSGAFAVLMNAGWNLAYEFVLHAPAW